MHAIWRLLLDDEFLEAYEHGIGSTGDHPQPGESTVSSVLPPEGRHPELGTVRDDKKRETLARTDDHVQDGTLGRIRRWIFQLGHKVKSTTFDYYLLARSWTPTSNAFSDRLSKFGFNPFKMLVPDFMHEFELGVFKAFFIHLLRILYAHGESAIQNLNIRPTFGRSTIRCFYPEYVSAEEIGGVELSEHITGLLPEPYNTEVLDLLFALAEWHTLAKLKMHTDTSIGLLRLATKEIGRLLRRFKRVTCPNFATKELPSAEAARGRRQARKAAKGGKGKATAPKTTANKKEFSLFTYKLHSLGDYVRHLMVWNQ
ncbi:hypothetical protein B0H10DRAFT_2445882 [Mycena sp. CBHHK59/15]|nr:hypothetical protein B0H10DRAFT_2447428 [Mycena sp. CBHHK59/15]KAJ6560724.1 hypothetical protein B0H10DRAFT_2445882 [Mycena sp. CBHHK59/15]